MADPVEPTAPQDADGAVRRDELRLLREEVSKLVKTIPGPVTRVSLRAGHCALEITWPCVEPAAGPMAALPAATSGTSTVTGADGDADDPALRDVVAPLVGTFYVAAEPGGRPFVSPHERVEKGQTVGIVEAMKLMTPVVAEWAGEVVEVAVSDGESVEFGEILVRLRVDTA